jgi:mRNA interferase RelE/StbE
MTAVYSKQAAKTLTNTESAARQRIKAGIKKIPAGDIKPLQGVSDRYRLRIGIWRILFYYIDAGSVMVYKISPRGDAYK